MPLDPNHLIKFFENISNDKFSSEMLFLLINRIDKLCFEECQIDRIACTLTPMCTRRFLLKLRIKNNLTIDDLPQFCYSVQKNTLYRDFYGKTVVYKPFDAYLYLIDFLDVFFHGDYRKLNKFISFKNWDETFKIFDDRIDRGEDFRYQLTGSYLIFKYSERIHIIFINENYALCNANKENIVNLEILYGLCELHRKLFFPEFKVKYNPSKFVEISAIVPRDVIFNISSNPNPEGDLSKLDDYFWNLFPKDLDALIEICKEIDIHIDEYTRNLVIKLNLNLETNKYIGVRKQHSLRYRDLRFLFNFIYRLHFDFYELHISDF
ncbi:MAG: hypothetical protein ACFE8A_09345 [Candidatus Hodarchaeota archaeon]